MKIMKFILAFVLLTTGIASSILLSEIISVSHWGFAISINFLFMIVFTLIFETLIPLNFSSKYFMPKKFEKNGRIYLFFGVKIYKNLLKLIGWEKIVRKDQTVKNKLESLVMFETWTKGPEVIHLLSAIFVIIFTIWIGFKFSISAIIWLVIGNIIFNIYPVMLQRYNRVKVSRLIKIIQNRV
jgi:hypothetical protein